MLGDSLREWVISGALDEIKNIPLESLTEWKGEKGQSLLHEAAENGQLSVLKELLLKGLPWNLLDKSRVSAAEYAQNAGHPAIYDFLVDEGCRAELLFSLISPADKDEISNDEYLNSKLTYLDGLLIDESGNAVMMGWEEPLMKEHVKHICGKPFSSVLNVGFGLGIIDGYIQQHSPSRHVIIEAHPDVLARMKDEGWYEKANVEIIEGRWQDVIESVGVFDGIFFDTFGEYYQDLKGFNEHVPNLLRDNNSIYSFFNGLAGTQSFFHAVYCKIAEMDLDEMNISTRYIELPMEKLGDKVWQGIARPYFSLDKYMLPICQLKD